MDAQILVHVIMMKDLLLMMGHVNLGMNVMNAEIIFSESNYWNQNRANRLVTGGIEVVDPAVPRKIAVSPRIKLIGAIAAIVGVCMGISIALIHEYFNGDKYVYPWQLPDLADNLD